MPIKSIRRWIAGSLVVLLGVFLLYVGIRDASWFHIVWGPSLAAAASYYTLRPGVVSSATFEAVWGGGVVLYGFTQLPDRIPKGVDAGNYSSGSRFATIVGALLLLHAIYRFVRHKAGARTATIDHPAQEK